MAEVTITINGRHYDIACDAGQEGRIIDLAGYVDDKISTVSQSGAAYSDSHLQILSLLVVADELFEAREGGASATQSGIAAVKKEIRAEIEAEYQGRLEKLQEQLKVQASEQAEPVDAIEQAAFEDTEEGKSVLKVLTHLSDRVNSLTAKLETI